MDARAHVEAMLKQYGALPCYRCGRAVTLEMKWDADHVVERVHGGADDPSNYWPSHMRCNRRAGGQIGAATTNARRSAAKQYDQKLRRW